VANLELKATSTKSWNLESFNEQTPQRRACEEATEFSAPVKPIYLLISSLQQQKRAGIDSVNAAGAETFQTTRKS